MNNSWLSENTSEGNDANYGDFNVPIWIFTTVLITVTSVLVVVLNSLCLIVLHRTNILKEPTKVFMASLNTADLILGAVNGLPTIVLYMVGWWPFGRALCMLYSTLGMVLFAASMMSLLLLTIDRYIGTFFPLRYPTIMTVTRSRLLVCCMWILTVLQAVFILLKVGWESDEKGHKYCSWQWEETKEYTILLTIDVLLLTVTITILYIKMMLTAMKHAQRINQEEQVRNQLGGNRSYKANRKSLTTVAIITASMYICYTPVVITSILYNVFGYHFPIEVFQICHIFVLSNSWLNVIIYFLRNKELRQDALKILKCCK